MATATAWRRRARSSSPASIPPSAWRSWDDAVRAGLAAAAGLLLEMLEEPPFDPPVVLRPLRPIGLDVPLFVACPRCAETDWDVSTASAERFSPAQPAL